MVGNKDGANVGLSVLTTTTDEGIIVGSDDGAIVGTKVGGIVDGTFEGAIVVDDGAIVGIKIGGTVDGAFVGWWVGAFVTGERVGETEGIADVPEGISVSRPAPRLIGASDGPVVSSIDGIADLSAVVGLSVRISFPNGMDRVGGNVNTVGSKVSVGSGDGLSVGDGDGTGGNVSVGKEGLGASVNGTVVGLSRVTVNTTKTSPIVIRTTVTKAVQQRKSL